MSDDLHVLALNVGSSSIKLGLYADAAGAAKAMTPVGSGTLDLQSEPVCLSWRDDGGSQRWPLEAAGSEDLRPVAGALLQTLDERVRPRRIGAFAHRVVHGGTQFKTAVRIDDGVLAALDALVPLAPLHQPQSLQWIRALQALRPGLPQTASFDTAFHAGQSDLIRRYALPREWHAAGIQRYGFHGLSFRFIAQVLAEREPQIAAGRVVVAHLGSGSSLCALQGGRSVETTMGFSVLDGVPMATRCGALDPGVLLHLMQQYGLDAAALQELLYHRSGLLGMSGQSGDVRVLRASGDAAAREALEILALRCAGEVARLAVSMGGLDALVFTGGIGEHDAATRSAIGERLGWLGLSLDTAANAAHAARIDATDSRLACRVIATDEQQVLAVDAGALLVAHDRN